MPSIYFTKDGIEMQQLNLNPKKASWPDGISARTLKETATETSGILQKIFQISYTSRILQKIFQISYTTGKVSND